MTTEAFKAKENLRGINRRKEERSRRIVWRVAFRREQADALEKAKALLKMPELKPTPHYFLCTVLKNKRGPYPDQITHINYLWAKYKAE